MREYTLFYTMIGFFVLVLSCLIVVAILIMAQSPISFVIVAIILILSYVIGHLLAKHDGIFNN